MIFGQDQPVFPEIGRDRLAAAFRLLGALFHSEPDDPGLSPFADIIRSTKLADEWPFGDSKKLDDIQAKLVSGFDDSNLLSARQRLFIGPDDLQAPPWGSVYLDREKVIFGESTLELRWFLARQGVTMNTGLNEPEDHIVLLLWLISDFIANDRQDACLELLQDHILPWSGRYLELLSTHAEHPFYEALAELTSLTLDRLADGTGAVRGQKMLYL